MLAQILMLSLSSLLVLAKLMVQILSKPYRNAIKSKHKYHNQLVVSPKMVCAVVLPGQHGLWVGFHL